jgi:hypothetical protein
MNIADSTSRMSNFGSSSLSKL